eukprot:Em0016g760a
MEVQCRVHFQFTWRPSAGPISSSHGGPVQGPSPVHMEVQLGPITSSHGGPVQGPSPQSGAGAAASQGYIIKVPGLKDEVSTLIICIQAEHQFINATARDLRGHPAALQTRPRAQRHPW